MIFKVLVPSIKKFIDATVPRADMIEMLTIARDMIAATLQEMETTKKTHRDEVAILKEMIRIKDQTIDELRSLRGELNKDMPIVKMRNQFQPRET